MRFSQLTPIVAVAVVACAAPAFAQPVSELTVTGRLPDGEAQSISQAVSYADLNLNDAGDRNRLVTRVNEAARRICTRLDQPDPGPANLGHSCQEVAVRDAMEQVHTAFADAAASAGYADTYGAPASATAPDASRR
jgi:UrcA family protein